MKCHLVYAVPPKGFWERCKRKSYHQLQKFGLEICWFGNRKNPDTSCWPKRSPYENTKHVFQGLSSRTQTLLYSLDEQVRCRFSPDDIFLGHPFFPYKCGKKGVTELSIDQSTRPKVFALISPLHCDTSIETNHINKGYLDAIDRMLSHIDVVFGIMGRYWWDRWHSSPYAHWMHKMVRLDMAIDVKYFPCIKTNFNPPGKRGFLYIGHSNSRKGTDFLSALKRSLTDYRFGWIGNGLEIRGVYRISKGRPLTPDFMRKIAVDFDFFISPSRADPNPTTILESMAWGFPVVCTPQSGYYETDYRRNIFWNDLERSAEVLKELQFTDEQQIEMMAEKAREIVDKEYTWDRFVGIIYQYLGIK